MTTQTNPLNWQVPIVDGAGRPTPNFVRQWLLQQQANAAIAASGAPTAVASDVVVPGTAKTFMRSDAAPAVQKCSSSVFGLCKVDGSTITASGGVISSAGGATGANPTATASDVAVNGSATTFMRSDAAPAVQKTSASQFGLCKVDGSTITASGGVISASGGGGGGYSPGTVPTVVQTAFTTNGGNSVTFGAAPTNGNLLVAMSFNPSSPTAASGWTQQVVQSNGTDYGVILTKVAGAGESTTQSPITGNGSTGAIMVWELHGQHSSSPFVTGLSQAEQSGVSNVPVLLPNVFNCIGLAAIGVVPSSTISTLLNAGTQDVLSNTNTRFLGAAHTDLSKTPMVGLMAIFSSSASSKGATCLVTS